LNLRDYVLTLCICQGQLEDKMKHSRRDFARLVVPFLALPLLRAAGQALPAPRVSFSAEQRADLDAVSTYLNGLNTLSAGFIQMSPNGGVAEGTFYLSRPGRLRFEYRPPSPTQIVATRGNLYLRNSRLNTVERYSIDDTPLGLLLRDNIDLKRNPDVLGIERRPGELLLRARSSGNRTQDNINIVFATEPRLEIRSWTVRDMQSGNTSVVFRDVRTGVELADSLFAVPVKAPSTRKS
jgi:outer membrane lipoprotein-sorting protein